MGNKKNKELQKSPEEIQEEKRTQVLTKKIKNAQNVEVGQCMSKDRRTGIVHPAGQQLLAVK